jgi:membrane fusion protein (multidrug efflux system)
MISASITSQANCQRKSHRLTIPIQVIIEQNTYQVNNWSAHGFQIQDLHTPLELDQTIDAALILPTGGASIVLNVEAKLRNIAGDLYGFEIITISDKNARVLRHYASLAIDGNYNHIDDLSADLFMVDVATPIQEPISLTQKESTKVHRTFLQKSFLYLVIGIVFLLIVLGTLLYNYLIVANSTGLISGNAHYYNAPKDGLLESLYVTNNQKVLKGQLLFEMQNSNEKLLLQNKLSQKRLLKKQLKEKKKLLKEITYTLEKKYRQMQRIKNQEKASLLFAMQAAKENYKRAKYLFEHHLINSVVFTQIQTQYLQLRENYNAVVLHKNSSSKNALLADQGFIKSQDQKITLQKTIDTLALDIKTIEEEINTLQEDIKKSVVTAQEDGIVHNIFHKQHSYLKFSENVLTLETRQKPYILTKLLVSHIDSVYIGQPCLIYSKRLDTFFNGHVVGIGYSITEGSTTNTVEISQNEIPVRIAFDDKTVNFHLNEYMKVYFLNSSFTAEKIIPHLAKNIILL